MAILTTVDVQPLGELIQRAVEDSRRIQLLTENANTDARQKKAARNLYHYLVITNQAYQSLEYLCHGNPD